MTQKTLSLKGLNFQATKIEESNNILTITLNRPEKKNALNNVMVNEICYVLAYAKQEREIRVVVIGAEGDTLSSSVHFEISLTFSINSMIRGSDK